jgi:hypothetical protein
MSSLISFIGGAAVGTLVTYLAKNEEARKTVDRFIEGMGESFTGFLHRMTPTKAEKPVSAEAEPVQTIVEEAAPAKKKPTRPRRTAKAKKVTEAEKPLH